MEAGRNVICLSVSIDSRNRFSSSSLVFKPDDQFLSLIYDAKNPGHSVLGKDLLLL